MLLRRVIEHVKAQNWTAVALDFFIVVMGVFIGIQVANFNEARVDRLRAQDYLERIGDDLDADIATINHRLKFWSEVADYGALGLDYAETGDAGEHTQWELLVAYFQASQISELALSQATFDELKSAGELALIADPDFRRALSNYYIFTASATVTERPAYREHVRGAIPLQVQNYIWENCYRSNGADWQEMFSCTAPIAEERAAVIVDKISADAALMTELRYWMSTMHVATLIGEGKLGAATTLRQSVGELLSKR